MSALHEIKHKTHDQDARGKVECFISYVLSALSHVKHEQGNALTILKKCHLNINIFAGSL